MKALAMVSIRQYEKARTSLSDYNHTVEMGIQALLQHRHFSESPLAQIPIAASRQNRGSVGVIIFGSDHGLCSPFNEQIIAYTLEQLALRHISPEQCRLAAIGDRLMPHLETAKQPIQQQFSLPSSLAGTTRLIQELLTAIEQWCFHPSPTPLDETHNPDVAEILLFYNQSRSSTAYQPCVLQLLPLNPTWLQQLGDRPWESSSIPMLSLDWEPLFSAVIRQYLFVSLYRATVESLASENAARLAAMQAAEKNIEERLVDLNADYRQQRQNSITEELLDIVSGFEALNHPR